MTGQAHWLSFAVVLLAAFPVVYLWILSRRAARNYLVGQSSGRCSRRGHELAPGAGVRL